MEDGQEVREDGSDECVEERPVVHPKFILAANHADQIKGAVDTGLCG